MSPSEEESLHVTTMRFAVGTGATILLLAASPSLAQPGQDGTSVHETASRNVSQLRGTLSDGARYLIKVPSAWNGTLFLYSHGAQGPPNPPRVCQDPFSCKWLLNHGIALAGGSYPTTGYDPFPFARSQLLVLAEFKRLVGTPTRTIAWGLSLGAAITADLVKIAPERFQGALLACPYRIEGSVGNFNERLDHVFALKTLLGFDQPLVNIGFGHGQQSAFVAAETTLIDSAQQTPEGRARLALAEAMVNTPDWLDDPRATEPAATDYDTREYNEFLLAKAHVYDDAERAYQESLVASVIGTYDFETGAVSGGNFSWNTRVNYREQLKLSSSSDLVTAMYAKTHLNLDADLRRLNSAQRIGADPGAVDQLQKIEPVFGPIGDVSVLTLSLEGDGVVLVNTAQGYADAVGSAGQSDQLRQLFVRRASHCDFTGSELITATQTLLARVDTGMWPAVDAGTLNAHASTFKRRFQGLINSRFRDQPRFDDFVVPLFLRNFNTSTRNPYP